MFAFMSIWGATAYVYMLESPAVCYMFVHMSMCLYVTVVPLSLFKLWSSMETLVWLFLMGCRQPWLHTSLSFNPAE